MRSTQQQKDFSGALWIFQRKRSYQRDADLWGQMYH